MPYKRHSSESKAEAVALAAIVGADAAAEQLGLGAPRIRAWSCAAGRTPADAIESADRKAPGELARAQVAKNLAAGKVRPKDAAVIAAIAQRNSEKVKEPEPADPEKAAADQVVAWLMERYA